MTENKYRTATHYARAHDLFHMIYGVAPDQRLGMMKDILDAIPHDAGLRNILTDPILLKEPPRASGRKNIAQAASAYTKKFFGVSITTYIRQAGAGAVIEEFPVQRQSPMQTPWGSTPNVDYVERDTASFLDTIRAVRSGAVDFKKSGATPSRSCSRRTRGGPQRQQPSELSMTDHTTRTCPICGSEFSPKNIRSVFCTTKCKDRASTLKAAARGYEAGKRDMSVADLQKHLNALEAVAQNEAEREAAKLLDDEGKEALEEALWRRAYAARLQQEREWARYWREAHERRKTRGWQPLRPSPPPPPEERLRMTVSVASHLLFSKRWADPSYSNRKFNAGRRLKVRE